ncbi:MAG: 30S ribosomal protein S12 methylthiotransferase RimO [Planctomycetota bacterium]
MGHPTLSMISLGCVKNTVDSERILAALVERGWLVAARPADADLLLVNTCGFIDEARDESYDVIGQAVALKESGMVAAVVVVGCLVQLLREELVSQFGGVDGWVGLAEPEATADACDAAVSRAGAPPPPTTIWPDPAARSLAERPRLRITPRHFAYLRIAEGCDNRCHYCLIPTIRGPLRSRPMDTVLDEARRLIDDGARELIVIAQDTTNYGVDLYDEPRLAMLLRQLRGLEGLEWLRLLYAHPAHLSEQIIDVLAEGGPILPYVDLPVQHASDRILKAMGRGIDQDGLRAVIGRVRDRVAEPTIRTSVIVGFPGESDADFQMLLGFIAEMRFERLGAFAYSRERGTPAAELEGQVPDDVKADRLDAVMALQQEIANEQSQALIGRELDVVVDGKGVDGEWAGRTVRDAPDVDGGIRFENTDLEPGLFGRARVTDAYQYDLVGRFVPAGEKEDGMNGAPARAGDVEDRD